MFAIALRPGARRALALLALALAAAGAGAAPAGLELTTVAERETVTVDARGVRHVELLPVEKVVPGDVVHYRTHYANRGSEPAAQIVIRNPIPAHMTYVMGSAAGAAARVEYSVDGGKRFAAAGELRVPDGDGGLRAATAADFTDIRWVLDRALAPGEEGQVSFQAQLQ